jgi:phosphoribosylformylglycinamidine synthase PurS subunit
VTTRRRPGSASRSASAGSIDAVQYEARIEVTQRPGVLDPQGATVERALPALGYPNVRDVQIGKCIRLVVDAPDRDAARDDVETMCERLLANPVIEAYDIELTELASSG